MDVTIITKDKLLTTMRSNRSKHRELFLKAQELFREKVIEELDRRLQEAREGGRITLTINLPEPVDYTAQYDDAIARIEWHEDDKVELTESEFREYVLNKWGWERVFAASSLSYVSGDNRPASARRPTAPRGRRPTAPRG